MQSELLPLLHNNLKFPWKRFLSLSVLYISLVMKLMPCARLGDTYMHAHTHRDFIPSAATFSIQPRRSLHSTFIQHQIRTWPCAGCARRGWIYIHACTSCMYFFVLSRGVHQECIADQYLWCAHQSCAAAAAHIYTLTRGAQSENADAHHCWNLHGGVRGLSIEVCVVRFAFNERCKLVDFAGKWYDLNQLK